MLAELIIAAALTSADTTKLGWLAGAWDFRDYALPAAGYAYEESGQRRCDWALDRKYIRCESSGTSRGKTRTYVFYLNINPDRNRIEMLSMFGNVAEKSLKVGTMSEDGRTLDLVADAPHKDETTGEMVRGWSVIKYDGSGAYVWESGHFPEGEPAKRTARFRDEVRRLP